MIVGGIADEARGIFRRRRIGHELIGAWRGRERPQIDLAGARNPERRRMGHTFPQAT